MSDGVMRSDGFGPLEGVRVLDLSQILAGPTCGLMLSDLGAEVIKIERPQHGDDTRRYLRPEDNGMAPSFVMINRGKKSIGLDLATEAGKEVLKRMVAHSDVLIENFRLGVMEKLGLGYETLRNINPKLIYCSITGFGLTGPLASKGGFDLILQAFAGYISVTGKSKDQLAKPGIPVVDVNAGIVASVGILAAYIECLKSGRGTRVETSLLQVSIQQLCWYAAAFFSHGVVPEPVGTAHPLIAPYQVYQAKDGGIAIGGGNQSNWKRVAEILGHPEWLEDKRFATGALRLKNRAELEVLIDASLATDTVAAWCMKFDEARVPAGPVLHVGQALDHPQTKAVQMVIEVDSGSGTTTRCLGLPLLFEGANSARKTAAPKLGEHTDAVLRSFAFSAEEIKDLRARRIVFDGLSFTGSGDDGFEEVA